jgi:hypothetical protein
MISRKNVILAGAMAAGLCLAAGRTFAWEDKDHVVVAAIAESHLSQETKAAEDDLLGGKSIADPRLCVWADAYVKRNKAVVHSQLQKAGVRLAKVVNDLFGAP